MSTSAARLRAVRRASRGFTLVELLGAMLAGMIVATGAFAFAKASSRAFQSEARLGNATSSATMGFRRLIADIRRASFLSTPNIQREYRVMNNVCLSPTGATPLGIQTLAGVHIEQWGYAPQTTLKGEFLAAQMLNDSNLTSKGNVGMGAGPLMPDRITLAGEFDSTEQFAVRSITPTGGMMTVTIQSASGPSTRLLRGVVASSDAVNMVFKQNRIVRLVDKRSFQHFGVIQSAMVQVDPTFNMPQIVLLLSGVAPMYVQGQASPGIAYPTCSGMDPQGTGITLSVVNKIRYEIRTADAIPSLVALYGNPLGPTTTNPNAPTVAIPMEDASRAELIRSELDYADQPIAGTDELVAEYAVDMHFGITVDTALPPGSNPPTPTITTYEIGSPSTYQYATSALLATNQPGPERIKSVRVRFATRSREADRSTDTVAPLSGWYSTQSGAPGGILRYQIPAGAASRWSRVRTLQAEVALLNQQGVFFL